MKKILILSMALLSLTMFSQTDSKTMAKAIDKSSIVVENTGNAITKATEKVYSDGTAIVKEAYSVTKDIAPKVEEALKSLGTSLKVGASNVWDILVKQQKVWSICTLIGLIASVFMWTQFWNKYAEWKKEPLDKHVFGIGVTVILASIGSVIVGIHFTEMITGFINPEFGAMNDVVNYAKQLK